jgi:superfamily II DNA/RNA helicase
LRIFVTPVSTLPASPTPDLLSHAATSDTAIGGFAALGVSPQLVAVLDRGGITAPFPIQTATLPDSLSGRDVLGRGRTGSGKTLAFALPLVAHLAAASSRTRPSHPRGLVLVPTRELANQVLAVVEPLATAVGLTTMTIFGGVGQNPQVRALRAGTDIIIACPGRLEDLIGQGHCDLGDVQITVLDEADHMADLGFLPGVKRLMDRTPKRGQRLLFSATLDRGVDVLVKRYLSNPVTHAVDPVESRATDMEHHVLTVDSGDKAAIVRDLAAGQGRSVLFTRTKHQAKKLAKQLTASGIPAVDLHGNLSQGARERNLAAFSSGSSRVLVATDIAARGIHVDEVALVVHVDPPAEHKAYLHRSGRTARAGASGIVVTIATSDQFGDVKTLTRLAGIKPTYTRVTPGGADVARLRGEPAAHVEPVEVPVVAARTPNRSASRSGGSRPGGSRPSGSRPGGSGQRRGRRRP